MASLRFYTTESLGAASKRGWTPEGFLLCQDVPIARVGTLLYGRGEIPVQPNADGIIRIIRDPADVFHPNAILSFAGKPLTDEHPPTKVTPDNWIRYSKGVILNPHQGDGRTENNQLLYADLLVQDRQTIQDVLDGKVEVSAGYDAEYEQVKPGEGKQHNIIGNHVALVSKGRCGPLCSIGDSAMAKPKVRVTRNTITSRQRQGLAFRDAIMAAFKTHDEDALVDELDKVPDMLGEVAEGDDVDVGNRGGTADQIHVHVHNGGAMDDAEPPAAAPSPPAASPGPATPPPAAGGGDQYQQLSARVDQLEQAVAILAQGDSGDDDDDDNNDANSPGMPPNTGDRAAPRRATVGDSTSMLIAYQEVIARSELLAPGQRHPTFDAAKPAKVTAETMCNLRRTTLDAAIANGDDGKDAVMAILGGPRDPSKHIKAMSCDGVMMAFNGASEIIRKSGMRGDTGGAQQPGGRQFGSQPVQSAASVVAKINEINRKQYGITGR